MSAIFPLTRDAKATDRERSVLSVGRLKVAIRIASLTPRYISFRIFV